MSNKYLRRLVILLGCVFVAVEAGYSVYGVILGDTDVVLRGLTILIALGAPVGEAIFMHRATQIRLEGRYEASAIAYGLWGFCFAVGIWMTVNGAAVREDVKSATRVAGWVKYTGQENTEKELTKEINLLTDQIAALNAATINDGGTARKLRPVAAIEADGRFLKSDRCANINPANTGQRTVCQEYASARDLAQKEADLKDNRKKLDAARGTLAGAEVVTSREPPMSKAIREKLNVDPTLFQALLLTALLHGITSFVWHTIPPRHAEVKRQEADDEMNDAMRRQFHFTFNTPTAPAASPLALSAPGRAYDPAKQAALIGTFWADLLPTLPKGQKQSIGNPAFLARFDNLCAQNNVESPNRDAFVTLSAAHLPGVENLGGQLWFTPA